MFFAQGSGKSTKVAFRYICAAFFAMIINAVTSGFAAANCEPFPQSNYWPGISHQSVELSIEEKYNGDWDKLLQKLAGYLTEAKAYYQKGNGLLIKKSGKNTRLSNRQLDRFIMLLEERIKITQCLADLNDMNDLANFQTASGNADGPPELEPGKQPNLFEAMDIRFNVATSCVDGTSFFRIINLGDEWPTIGSFGIYRLGRDKPEKVLSRRMALKIGQVSTFRVAGNENISGTLGLFVEPGWTKRDFKVDASLTCTR